MAEPPLFDRDIAPLLKRHCVKCHGPTKHEGKLNLSTIGGIIRGGESGNAIVPHDADASLVWKRVTSNEMPPETPLSQDEKLLLQTWINTGTTGLRQKSTTSDASEHWAFRPLMLHTVPSDQANDSATVPYSQQPAIDPQIERSRLDSFLTADLARDGLKLSPEANRTSLLRRLSFDLTGLPPTPEAIKDFIADPNPDAFERVVDRYLASPHFGERFGKIWLDSAGYADSNGYFNADTDRPLAYRYRDYVIRAFNGDKPFDQFIKEQLAGDELANLTASNGERLRNGGTAAFTSAVPNNSDATKTTPSPAQAIELIEATHYLRNGQDGTGESDGNPDEVRVDRYTVIETALQNISTGLLGLTIQCAKCHDHKFEPLTQRDYYSFQSILIPAFPPEQWLKPNDRFVYVNLPGEIEAWQEKLNNTEERITKLRREIIEWTKTNRPQGKILFADSFEESPESLANRWTNVAPGDDVPGGTAAVNLNSTTAPGAVVANGALRLIEGGPGGDKWLSTKEPFDWTPDAAGSAIQVTFDLVDNRIENSKASERIGYFIALHDFNDNSPVSGGNILIDGHPSSSTAVHPDYPGPDSTQAGVIGTTGYQPGHNYGIRITNTGNGKFVMEHLVDWQIEEKSITFKEADLPPGGFGFEFCCDRSFVVDNVVIESFSQTEGKNPLTEFLEKLKAKRQPLDEAMKIKSKLGTSKPGKIAWTTNLTDHPPQTHIFLRGDYNSPGDPVTPGGFEILRSPPNGGISRSSVDSNKNATESEIFRRLQFSDWMTKPETPASSLIARVHVNRIWQHLFATGIVSTPDNFGISGSPPTHPELLDWLATELIRSGWSSKNVVRRIVNSTAYRQSSDTDANRSEKDPGARRLSRFPVRRLDAEAIRDFLLLASGDLDDQMFGPYIATSRTGTGETVVAENNSGARRRSIYLLQKRTQVHSLLQVFDAPSIVFNSTRRARSTMPLQSLSLLNSEFSRTRARDLAIKLQQQSTSDSDRLQFLFASVVGYSPSDDDVAASTSFLESQTAEYLKHGDATIRAWTDLCHALLISNASLYID